MSSIKEVGQGMSAGRSHQRLRAGLIVSEVALACTLLVGAGLLLRSFLRVLDVDLGFQPAHTATIHMDFADGTSALQRAATRQEVVRNVSAVPGVEAAALTDAVPLQGVRAMGLWRKGARIQPGEYPLGFTWVTTPGYFKAMGMRVMEGRDFDWGDRAGSPRVVILNQTAARQFWPGQDPLDRVVIAADSEARVVGIVPDVREVSVEGSAGPQMYMPAGQNFMVGSILVVRSALPLDVLEPSVMRIMKSVNPTQPAYKMNAIQNTVDRTVSPRRFFMLLVSAFAGLGLLLAGLGIYGVISYSVVQQTQEIGIRMALGAAPGRVQARVLSETFRVTVIGVAVGIAASFAATKLIATLLFGIEPTDPLTFGGMVALLAIAALMAGFLPAMRAARIDPMISLRAN